MPWRVGELQYPDLLDAAARLQERRQLPEGEARAGQKTTDGQEAHESG